MVAKLPEIEFSIASTELKMPTKAHIQIPIITTVKMVLNSCVFIELIAISTLTRKRENIKYRLV